MASPSQSSNDPPGGKSGKHAGGAIPETQVDKLLSRVSDLTDNVAREVGSDDAAATGKSLDDQIDEDLRRREQAGAQDGGAAPSDSSPKSKRVVQLGPSKPRRPEAAAGSGEAQAARPTRTAAAEGLLAESPARSGTAEQALQCAPPQASLAARAVGAALDAFDRPFGWCGPKGRAAAGWLACALFFAACLVFILSFFP